MLKIISTKPQQTSISTLKCQTMQVARACRTQLQRLGKVQRVRSLPNRMAHRNFTVQAAPLRYARSLSITHWCVAAGILSCFATVEIKKRQPKDSQYIGPLMKYHKSFGLLVAGFVAARIVLRVATRKPAHMEGPKALHILADAGHIALCMCFTLFLCPLFHRHLPCTFHCIFHCILFCSIPTSLRFHHFLPKYQMDS